MEVDLFSGSGISGAVESDMGEFGLEEGEEAGGVGSVHLGVMELERD